MVEVSTEIVMDAPRAHVWNTLMDVASYPAWHPMIVALEGELRGGGRGVLVVRAGARRTASVKIRYKEVAEARELSWHGGIAGVLSGTHYFRLEDAGEGRTRLCHGEQFDGVLAAPTLALVKGYLERFYGSVNEAIRARAEASL